MSLPAPSPRHAAPQPGDAAPTVRAAAPDPPAGEGPSIRPAAGSAADPADVARVRGAPERLEAFNTAGVLAPADVHAACTYGRLGGETDETVLLAAALAVRAPRRQHVCVDLAQVRRTVTVDDGEPGALDALPWPESLAAWRARLAASPLVADGADAPDDRPLRLVGSLLYLDRYWRYERRVLARLTARAGEAVDDVDDAALADGLDGLFGQDDGDRQRAAAATAVRSRLAVIAGGPGTGKTRTIARMLVLLAGQARAAGAPLPRVALAAPTGKAAQRMEEALAGALTDLVVDDEEVRGWLLGVQGVTLHRLLRRRPGSHTRFRHHATNPLPHDVVVVDESSMASLSLFAKLLDAVRPEARLVLVGDPNQLASVEAGSVLGDIVGPAAAVPPGERPGAPPAVRPAAAPLAGRIVVLRRGYRFQEGIAELAAAIQAGDPDAVCTLLADDRQDVRWLPSAPDAPDEDAVAEVRARVRAVGAPLHDAAQRGDAATALGVLDRLRILCAHRRGPFGVASWVPLVQRWLGEDVAGFDASTIWHVGRPVLVTRNDYQIGVLNGDVGVTVAHGDGLAVAFRKGEGIRLLAPTRLEHVETVHAMTVHKAQGSEFDEVVAVLPPPDSPILTRELLYTAATRARRRLTLVASEEAVRAAVARQVQRASGLRAALWGTPTTHG